MNGLTQNKSYKNLLICRKPFFLIINYYNKINLLYSYRKLKFYLFFRLRIKYFAYKSNLISYSNSFKNELI